jgi:hypothetical protein
VRRHDMRDEGVVSVVSQHGDEVDAGRKTVNWYPGRPSFQKGYSRRSSLRVLPYAIPRWSTARSENFRFCSEWEPVQKLECDSGERERRCERERPLWGSSLETSTYICVGPRLGPRLVDARISASPLQHVHLKARSATLHRILSEMGGVQTLATVRCDLPKIIRLFQ